MSIPSQASAAATPGSGGALKSHVVFCGSAGSQTTRPASWHCPKARSVQTLPKAVNHSSAVPSQLPSRLSHSVSVSRMKPETVSTSGGYSHDQPVCPLQTTSVFSQGVPNVVLQRVSGTSRSGSAESISESQSLSTPSQSSTPGTGTGQAYSQPFCGKPSISYWPSKQACTRHSPARHSGMAPAGAQGTPQAPQFSSDISVSPQSIPPPLPPVMNPPPKAPPLPAAAPSPPLPPLVAPPTLAPSSQSEKQ